MNTTVHNVVIIGSGPAGLTAGIYTARANLKPLILEGKKPGGQLMGTSYVENWPGEKSILGPQLMINMQNHAKSFDCTIRSDEVTKVDFSQKPFTIWTDKGSEFKAHSVIITTGSTPRRLQVPGEDEYWGKGVTTCAACDGAFYKDKKVLIVGGGDTAMEDASFMTKFTNQITVVHILDQLTASFAMKERVLKNPDIKVIYQSTLTEIRGNGSHVTHATILNQKTGQQEEVETDGIFIAIGLSPNTKPFIGQIELDNYGYIILKEGRQTSVEGVFAAGDVADYRYRQAITSAGTGCMAAFDAERYLCASEK
jgi:thioredoxin reductase (NADPH)